jgi:outer membrane protein OmpA-like peptidoglycan-associated protein
VNRRRNRLGSLLTMPALLATAAVGITACDIKEPQKCGWMQNSAGTTGRTAVLIDTSNSTRAKGAASQSPNYAYATTAAVKSAIERRDTVSFASFSGTASNVVWASRDRSADWKDGVNNPKNQASRKKEAEDCLAVDTTAAAKKAPQAKGTDILHAITTAAGWLREGKGEKRLVVATDGLANTGCANLTGSTFSDDKEIDAIAQECVRTGDLKPEALKDVTVEFIGVGRPSAEQPVPTTAQVDWLGRLWQKICATGGGKCTINPTSVADTDQTGAQPTDGVEDAAVPFNRQHETYTISAAQFDTDQTTLKASSSDLILQISVRIRNRPNVKVEVLGYADSRGSAEHNMQLSAGRAAAVAKALRDHNVPGVTSRGLGVTDSCPYVLDLPAGASEDEKLQCFRRVDVVAT